MKADFNKVSELPFSGEEMQCILCNLTKKSKPNVESGWRAVDLGGRRFYACPDEFPPDDAGERAFGDAYLRWLLECLNQVKGTGRKSVQ